MKTASICVQNLCVPCHNRCRYCLLSWDGKTSGVDYEQSRRYARRFYDWLRTNRPELGFDFYFGYSMEHPRLTDAIDFMGSIGSAGGRFLQLDGLAFRTAEQTVAFLMDLKTHGVRSVNLTFYGTQEYHDRFAGRNGDFDYLMTILHSARAIGLEVTAGVPVTRENAGQLEQLLALLEPVSPRCFIPHAEGRGASLDPVRLRSQDYDALSDAVKSRLNTRIYKSEADWLRSDFLPIPEKRALTVTLTPENVNFFESLPFPDTIAFLEGLDDAYYAALPSVRELMALYGDPAGDGLFRFRDLFLHYQRAFLVDHNVSIYDVTDERNCFSRRY